MKKILFLVLLCLTTSAGFCQEAAKNLFTELGGIGGLSLNFDTRLTPKKNGIGGRIGIGGGVGYGGYFGLGVAPAIYIPYQVNYLIGKDDKHYLEFGVGTTFVTNPYNGIWADIKDFKILSHTFGHLDLAYRRQPANGGFFFRVAYNPLFGSGLIEPINIGLSFGYTFRSSHK
jgi:hypothetical protein